MDGLWKDGYMDGLWKDGWMDHSLNNVQYKSVTTLLKHEFIETHIQKSSVAKHAYSVYLFAHNELSLT